MSIDEFSGAAITGIVHIGIAVLLVAIVVLNGYAILHAWRTDRPDWAILLAVLFVLGGGIATAIYLVFHWDEPLPPRRSRAAASRMVPS